MSVDTFVARFYSTWRLSRIWEIAACIDGDGDGVVGWTPLALNIRWTKLPRASLQLHTSLTGTP